MATKKRIITASLQPTDHESRSLLSQARVLFAQAQNHSEGTIRSTRAKLARHCHRRRRTAFARGFEAGLHESARYLAERAEALDLQFRAALLAMEERAIGLALEIAREVSKDIIESSHESLAKRLQAALQALPRSAIVRIRLPGKSAANLADNALRALAVEDPTLPPGRAFIETAFGELELDWELHFSNLADATRMNFYEERRTPTK